MKYKNKNINIYNMRDSLFAYIFLACIIILLFHLILIFNNLSKPKDEINIMIDTYGKYKRI